VFFVRNFGAKPIVTIEKLPKRHSYEKHAQKTLMKLTPGISLEQIKMVMAFKSMHAQSDKATAVDPNDLEKPINQNKLKG